MKSIFSILILLSVLQLGYSQDSYGVDSSLCVSKVKEYESKMHEFHRVNSDSCIYYTYKTLECNQKIKNSRECVLMLDNLTALYFEKEDFLRFLALQDSTFSEANKSLDKDDPYYLYVFTKACISGLVKGEYDNAIEMGIEATKMERVGDLDNIDWAFGVAEAYNRLSEAYTRVGEYELAIQSSQRSDSFNKDALGERRWSPEASLRPLAYAYLKSEKFDKAADTYKQISNFYAQYNENVYAIKELHRSNIKLAEVYTLSKDYRNAKNVLNELSKIENELAGVDLGDFKSALAYYLKAIENQDKDQIINLLEDANDLYKKHLINSASDEKLSKNLDVLSQVYADKGDFAKAKQLSEIALDSIGAKQFLDQPEKIINKVFALKFLKNLLEYSIEENNDIDIRKYAIYIKEICRVLILDNSTAETKFYWAKENLDAFNLAISALIDIGDIGEAFVFSEENKSNILINDLNKDLINGIAGIDEELIRKERSLRSKISFYRNQLSNSKNETYGEYVELKLQAEQNLNNLTKEIQSNNADFYKLKYASSDLSISDVKNLLNDDSALIEYFISGENSYAFFITPKSEGVIKLKEYDLLKQAVDSFYSVISDKKTNTDLEEISKKLHTIFLSDIEDNFGKNISNLVIVPDAMLSNIPFGLLKDKKGNSLGFNYNITYQYSTKLWKLLKERKKQEKAFDFVGYAYDNGINNSVSAERSCYEDIKSNLKCSVEEVSSIASILKDEIIETSASDMDDVFDKASDSRILHLATHACADPANPDLSTLYFRNQSIKNSEIQLRNINVELVVLSACESGFGTVFEGEGSMSLSKSFFHAGCNSTVVSLWPVDDCTTSELMKYFYSNLYDGQSKSEALKNAQLQYIENAHATRRKPYYWAGFVLIGDDIALWNSHGNYMILLCAFLALILIIGLVTFLKKQS